MTLINNCRANTLPDFFKMRQRALAVGEIFFREQQISLPDMYFVAVFQNNLIGNLAAVDEYAVFALHIERQILLFLFIETYLHVLAGNMLVKNLNQEGFIPADHIRPTAERIIVPLLLPCHYNYRSHQNSQLSIRPKGNIPAKKRPD